MYVLTAAHDFYPDPGSGGTGRYVYETSRRLVDDGHRVAVIARRRGDVPHRETVEGIDVFRYDLEVADRAAPAVAAGLFRARDEVAAHVAAATADGIPDVLSAQGPITSLLVDRALDDGVPRVPTFHSPWPTEYRLRTRRSRSAPRRWVNAAIRRRLERRLLARADRVVVLSDFMRERLRHTYGDVADPTVVPGGVDGDRFAPDAGPSGLVTGGDPAVLTVRRLSERMGLDLLLSAFASVREARPDAHLYLAGDGPLRDRLERTAAGMADGVSFLGHVPDAELPAVYATADLFVLPTTELEGFGLATLEALASGTPVVGTPVGGTVEILADLEEASAVPAPMLLPAVDADALADAVLAWGRQPERALSAAGRTCRRYAVRNYAWERTAGRLESLYADVVDRC